MVTGAVEVVLDTLVLALPVRVVLGLKLSRRRRFSVGCVFLLGGLYVALFNFPFLPVPALLLLLLHSICPGSNNHSVSSSPAFFASYMPMFPAIGRGSLSPKLDFGPLYTSAQALSVLVCHPLARSSLAHLSLSAKLPPPCRAATRPYVYCHSWVGVFQVQIQVQSRRSRMYLLICLSNMRSPVLRASKIQVRRRH